LRGLLVCSCESGEYKLFKLRGDVPGRDLTDNQNPAAIFAGAGFWFEGVKWESLQV